jgi:putative ABC transport system permease protein
MDLAPFTNPQSQSLGAAALAASRSVEAILFNVPGADPRSLTVATAAIVAAALLGCLVPALRAARLDPADALRAE